MWAVDIEWNDLEKGYQTIADLNAKLRNDWDESVKDAQQRKFDKDLKEWQQRYDANKRKYKNIVITSALFFAISLPSCVILFFATLLFPSTFIPLLVLLFFASTITFIIGISWLNIRSTLIRTTNNKPTIEQGVAGTVNISTMWWYAIYSKARGGENLGDVGEDNFLYYLTEKLDNTYIAIQRLPITRTLDVDLLVVGPTGIWVFECKHWSGKIICKDNTWRRIKHYFKPGGYPVIKEESIEPFDEQWIRERDAVITTLRRRIPTQPIFQEIIKGGLVFTHQNVKLDIDQSCKSKYGTSEHWSHIIQGSPQIPEFTAEMRIRVLDRLLSHARSFDNKFAKQKSCYELANSIYEDGVQKASAFVSKHLASSP